MATISENIKYYEQYDWARAGEEWSIPWGGSWPMWITSLHPRIRHYLPAEQVVEIGSGYGRIAKFLLPYAERMYLYDIIPKCVEACSKSFENESNVLPLLTQGASLPDIDDNSTDLVLSFYSLVGSDVGTIESYIREISRILKPDGVAFLHHSNVKECVNNSDDQRLRTLLAMYRDDSVSAKTVSDLCGKYSLVCIEQETINWDIKEELTDCFSTIVPLDSRWVTKDHDPLFVRSKNYNFVKERSKAKLRYSKKPGKSHFHRGTM